MLNWKNAVLWGVILWVLIFAEVSIVMFIPGLEQNRTIQNIIHWIILPILVLFTSFMYFKGRDAGAKRGFALGIFFLIISTILDLAITIPLFVKTYEFFYQWQLYVGFLEVIIFSSVMGFYLGRKTPQKTKETK